MHSKGMNGLRRAAKAMALIGMLSLAACGGGGSGDSGSAGEGQTVGREYFPMSVGDRWVYQEWIGDTAGALTTTLVKAAHSSVIQGRNAITVESVNANDGQILNTQYIAVSDSAVTQLPNASSVPMVPAIDLLRFPLTVGQSFLAIDQMIDENVDYDGDQRTEQIQIAVNVNVLALEPVQTDVGSFQSALHVQTVITLTRLYSSGGPSDVGFQTVDEWYGSGVGLLRQDAVVSSSGGAARSSSHMRLTGYSVGNVRSEQVSPQATLLAPTSLSGPFAGIELRFDEAMDPAAYNPQAVELRDGAGQLVPMTIYSTTIDWRFYPSVGRLPGGEYTLSLTPQLTDMVGNPVAPHTWAFTVDATAPAVVATSPASGAKYVDVRPTITVDFSEEMAPAGFTSSVYLIGTSYLPVDVSLQGRRLTITPRSPLEPDTNYTVTIQPGITDTVGNGFERTFSIDFRTDPGRFDYPVASAIGSSPAAVAIGDINGDGRKDVVMTNEFYFDPATDFKMFVYTQGAGGQLAAPVGYVTRANYGCRPASVQVGDLNGDGRDDVAIGELGCGVEIFLQNNAGQLVSANFLSASESYLIRISDMNGDGRLDIVGLGASSQIAVWLQDASGNIGAPRNFSIGSVQPMDLDIGDVNGDGRPDIVVLHSSSTITVLLQEADGGFGNAKSHVITDTPLNALAVGDINGDGREDVVFTRWWSELPGVLLQNASGNLVSAPNLPGTGAGVSTAVEVADINGDGRKDVIVRGESGFGISVQQPDGAQGSLRVLHGGSSAAPFNTQSLAIGDVNSDGRPDLVASGITVALNRGDAVVAGGAATPLIANDRPTAVTLLQRAQFRRGLGAGAPVPPASRALSSR